MSLSSPLYQVRDAIERHAVDFGLDFFEVVFESVSYEQMNMIAAYGGFPTRFPHWKFGMEYERLAKGYEYGLSKIYELVINNDPSYAYLMSSNADIDQKLIMAHVFGHVDFFKNNFSFAHTDRKMMDTMANHSGRIRSFIDRFGQEPVETFIDSILSIENLIDRHAAYIKRHREPTKNDEVKVEAHGGDIEVRRLHASREYMRGYINPQDYLDEQRDKLREDQLRVGDFPSEPVQDVVGFILEHAPLQDWQREILSMLHDEFHYFAPQGQTKIINEGWASFWHTTILTQKALHDSELIDYADLHAGTMGVQPGSINPYKLGLELFRNIEDRWNKGQFGKAWFECDDMQERSAWDTGVGLGRDKIFEVRKHYNDVTLIDEFLTEDFAREQKLFNYDYDKGSGDWRIATREFKKVKRQLLDQLTNFAQPSITVVDANFENQGALLLKHAHTGVDLRHDYMRATLRHVQALWSRAVVLYTTVKEQSMLIKFDGTGFSEVETDEQF